MASSSYDMPPSDGVDHNPAAAQLKGGPQTGLMSMSHEDAAVGAGGFQDGASHAMPAQIGSDLSLTLDFRDRSSTLGSIGDLGLFGLGPTTPTASSTVHIVGGDAAAAGGLRHPGQPGSLGAILELHQGDSAPGGQQPPTLGSPQTVSASTPGSLGSGTAPNPLTPQPHPASLGPPATAAAQPVGKPLPFPGMRHINHAASASASSTAHPPTAATTMASASAHQAAGMGSAAATGMESQPSSGGNASAFFSGNTMIAHTPPSAMGPASYEARHFGKRARAGSLSGRLRSASDAGQALEEKGLIDRTQKGVLKDLIVAGDDALQEALDLYEGGDAGALEEMIKSGKLQNNSSADIDVLGDLDLDFLTVDDDDDFGIGTGAHMGLDAHHAAAGGVSYAKSLPIPIASSQQQQQQAPMQNSVAHNVYGSGNNAAQSSNTAYADDGIGELEFNGEYSSAATEEEMHLPSGLYGSQTGATAPLRPTMVAQAQDPSSNSAMEGRYRANSLAFGALLNEPSPEQSYGKWMDQHPAGSNADQNAGRTPQGVPSSNVVGANGSLYIIPGGGKQPPIYSGSQLKRPAKKGGIAGARTISTAERTKNDIKLTASAINRLEQVAGRRREKQEKREQKEREKRDKKVRKDRETKEKKRRDSREKQERKVKREAVARAKNEKKKEKRNSMSPRIGKDSAKDFGGIDDEPKEVVSGTGRPRSLSDPNLSVALDNDGLLQIDHPDGWVGAYSPDSRKLRIERFLEKRNHRVWTKKVKYDVRKNFADSRLRVKGRFVKKEDELLMRDLMSLT